MKGMKKSGGVGKRPPPKKPPMMSVKKTPGAREPYIHKASERSKRYLKSYF